MNLPKYSTFSKPPPPPQLPPAFASATGKTKTAAGRKPNYIHEDSSWITNPRNARDHAANTKQVGAMKGMTQAFRESMRCSPEEAESQTSKEDRIDCIHFGNLLVALDVMKDCMKIYGMRRTPVDLEHHVATAKRLYMGTPPESRDSLLSLLEQSSSHEAAAAAITNSNDRLQPLARTLSLSSPLLQQQQQQQQQQPTEPPLSPTRAPSESPAQSCASEIPSDPTKKNNAATEELSSLDRKTARNSMFWLCNFVRYTYNVHRLVLQVGHDPVDASPMAFMRYLQPYFGDYYTERKNSKAFLHLLKDYQEEHFLDADTPSNSQAEQELKSFLGVLEVVLYLWTPAFQEMALKGGEFLSR